MQVNFNASDCHWGGDRFKSQLNTASYLKKFKDYYFLDNKWGNFIIDIISTRIAGHLATHDCGSTSMAHSLVIGNCLKPRKYLLKFEEIFWKIDKDFYLDSNLTFTESVPPDPILQKVVSNLDTKNSGGSITGTKHHIVFNKKVCHTIYMAMIG